MDFLHPASPTAAQTRAAVSRANTVKMLQEALAALDGDELANVVYTTLADHPGLTAAQLESLSNRLGRTAHERARHD